MLSSEIALEISWELLLIPTSMSEELPWWPLIPQPTTNHLSFAICWEVNLNFDFTKKNSKTNNNIYLCFLETLPQLYNETQKRKELIREVEMGPFKHEVDDGLDLRKAAFECMYTLLDTCIDRLDIFEFLTHVQDGLKDHYDIKVNWKQN